MVQIERYEILVSCSPFPCHKISENSSKKKSSRRLVTTGKNVLGIVETRILQQEPNILYDTSIQWIVVLVVILSSLGSMDDLWKISWGSSPLLAERASKLYSSKRIPVLTVINAFWWNFIASRDYFIPDIGIYIFNLKILKLKCVKCWDIIPFRRIRIQVLQRMAVFSCFTTIRKHG